MAQGRKWSVVIHDVPVQAKELCHSVLKKLAKSYIIALEPYGHQEGHHLHLFYELKSPSPKTRQLKKWEQFGWGRVQCDPARGTQADQQVYVTNPSKDKTTDPSPIIFPNRQAETCNCKPHWLYASDLKAYNDYERKVEEQLQDLYFRPNQIQDFEKWDEELERLYGCRRRSLELLMKWNYPCSKCGLPRAFFQAKRKSQAIVGGSGPPQATTAPPEELGGEAQGADFFQIFFSGHSIRQDGSF